MWGFKIHDTALITGEAFFKVYGALFDVPRILDVGSMDVNGSLRTVAPVQCDYLGVDRLEGFGVDLVVGEQLPFADCTFDLVVSTSCFEHDPMFWYTFTEMVRVSSGFVYFSAPASGRIHRYPIDCWRFYPDAGKALADWSIRQGYFTEVVESFLVPPLTDGCFDFLAVYRCMNVELPKNRMLDALNAPV